MLKCTGVYFPVIVCGGRRYSNQHRVNEVLTGLINQRRIDLIGTGGARGADTLAMNWARARCLPLLTLDADWEKYGRKAGPIRNGNLVYMMQPKLCVAFPGGRGTEDMVLRCKRLPHCYVIEVDKRE